MKYKSYEDSAVQNTTGLNLELLDCKDEISARNTNRPIINLYENQESNYNLIQTLLKTVYGNSQGVIPDVYEDFAPENFSVGSFKNDTSNYYLRIPTGMFLGRKVTDDQYIHSTVDGNPFSKFGEYHYKDEIHKENFLQDALKSYIIENKPEINLYVIELAKLIDLDLSDLTNDIKIGCDLVPYAYKIAIVDPQTGIQMLDSAGSPKFVLDDDSNILYKAQTGKGNYNIVGNVSTIEAVTNIQYNKKPNNTTPSNINVYTVVDGEYAVVKAENGEYTNNIEDAIIATDTCDNKKYKTGYYIKTVRATSADDEIVYLPNRAENASWKICLPALTAAAGERNEYVVTFSDEYGVIDSFSFDIFGSASVEGVNDKLYSNLLSLSSKFVGERFSQNKNSDIVNGVKIISNSSNVACNDYTITITINGQAIVDYLSGETLENIKATAAVQQKYYDNIFELTNAFLGYYSSYLIKIENIYEYLNLETIISVPTIKEASVFHLYYDLNANIDNATNSEYDKTGRFRLVADSENNAALGDNFILMYDITLDNTSIAPNTVQVTSVTSYLNTLDRRMISTKRAELKSLLVEARSELSNYIHIKDALDSGQSSREIEITDYHENSDDNQTRITSPILRLVDAKDDTKQINNANITTKQVDDWTDSGNGDTISDFFEESTLIRDFETESAPHYLYHNDNTNKGIIIDKNKGIRIFNNDSGETDGLYSYSSFKPIEIVSKKGNINLFNYDNITGRINIANLTDSEKNIVDIKGITRIRSAQEGQLVVKKIATTNNEDNKANIYFAVGTSYSKEDEKAKDLVNGKNINVGSLNFYTGKNYIKNNTEESNLVDKNRFFSLNLSRANESNNTTALVVRNAASEASSDKKVFTVFGDVVPSNQDSSFTLGYPLGSRTYIPSVVPGVPYNSYELISDLKVDNEGNSTEYLNSEGRWKAAFIHYGYLGHLTLSDRTSDIKNADAREGALRLGNSNIYDVSSIYINCDKTSGSKNRTNYGTINFDNALKSENNLTENTIASAYEENNKKLAIVLYRNLGTAPSFNTNSEIENNACAALFTPTGTELRKNLYIRRQLWVNQRDEDTSTYDNSAMVVKGQSVLRGELVVGKDAAAIDTTAVGQVTANKEDGDYNNGVFDASDYKPYKLYNWEYWSSATKSFGEGGYKNGVGDDILFLFRLYGRSYFDGDITINKNRRFTEDTSLNRTLTIYNNNYADKKYNERNVAICPAEDNRYVSETISGVFWNKEETPQSGFNYKLPRHNTSLDVKSGLIKFGSDYTDNIDASDVVLNGSQYIRRRLEIGTADPSLFDEISSDIANAKDYELPFSRLILDGLYNSNGEITKPVATITPKLYVEGGSQFNGDVVFGHKLTEDTTTKNNKTFTYHRLTNKKADFAQDDSGNGTKIIFWGNNVAEITKTQTSSTELYKDWKSDFDFHGKTWFDNTVRIGMDSADVHKPDSNEDAGIESGHLEIFGKDSQAALDVKGSTKTTDSVTSTVASKYIKLRASNNRGDLVNQSSQDFAVIELNGNNENHLLSNDNPASDSEDTGFLKMLSSGSTRIRAQASGQTYTNDIVLDASGEKHTILGQNAGLEFNVSKVSDSYINILAAGKDVLFDYKNNGNDATLSNFNAISDNISLQRTDNHKIALAHSSSVDTVYAGASDNVNLTLNSSSGATLKGDNCSLTLNDSTATLSDSTDSIKLDGSSQKIEISAQTDLIKASSKVELQIDTNNKIELASGSAKITSNTNEILELGSGSSTLKTSTSYLTLSSNSVALDSNAGSGKNAKLSLGEKTGSLVVNGGPLELTGGNATIKLEDSKAKLPATITLNGSSISYSSSTVTFADDVKSNGDMYATNFRGTLIGSVNDSEGSVTTKSVTTNTLTIGSYTLSIS
jgi:hypothetical protein